MFEIMQRLGFVDVPQDLRTALRGLVRDRSFTLAAVLCLALGIGASTSVFAIIDALFLRPPPGIREPRSLVRLDPSWSGRGSTGWAAGGMPYPAFVSLQEDMRGLVQLAGFAEAFPELETEAGSQTVRAQLVSAEFFSVVGAVAARGRFFVPEEDWIPNGAPVVVLGSAFWRRQFGGEPDVVDRQIVLNGRSYRVIGVASAGFNGIAGGTVDIWLPMTMANQLIPWKDPLTSRSASWVAVVGRVPPTTHIPQVRLAATHALQHTMASEAYARDVSVTVAPVGAPFSGGRVLAPGAAALGRSIARGLTAVACFILLIVCANVANLLLIRGLRRRGEIAVRLALGAGRMQLVRMLLAESAVLAAIGACLGLVLSLWGVRLSRLMPGPQQPISLDIRAVAFCLLVAAGTLLLSGVTPALLATRVGLVAELKEADQSSSYRRSRLREALLIGQVALALVLLVGAGLTLRTMWNLRSVDPGMDLDQVLVITPDLRTVGAGGAELPGGAMELLRDRIATLPGVARASVATFTPFFSSLVLPVALPGSEALGRRNIGSNAIDSSYFRALGISIRRGRHFAPEDYLGGARVAIVNETMARQMWPGQDPLGECFLYGSGTLPGQCTTVVGIARDAKYSSLNEGPTPFFYVPMRAGRSLPFSSVFVRTRGAAVDMIPSLRALLQDTQEPVVRRASVRLLASLARWELEGAANRATWFLVFGIVALAVAAIGIYGVAGYSTSQRTREFGLRIALGCAPSGIVMLVVADSLRMSLAGIAIGAALALIMSRPLNALLFGVGAWDLTVYAVATCVIVMTTLVAGAGPALRAAQVSPARALRHA